MMYLEVILYMESSVLYLYEAELYENNYWFPFWCVFELLYEHD